ncbi:beta-lactamase family protein [Candidatus Sumerlaeota bacterium]|nr:beta-lactamase family protein [Candidatus Sumerlaeota bacterium]
MAEHRLQVVSLRRLLFLSLVIVCTSACGQRAFKVYGRPSDAMGGLNAGTLGLVHDQVRAATREGAICGGVLVVCHKGEEVDRVAFGVLGGKRRSGRVDPETLFDVASLTKPLVGLPLAIKLQGETRDPDARVFIGRLAMHTSLLSDGEDYAEISAQFAHTDRATHRNWQALSSGRISRRGPRSPSHEYSNSNYAVLSYLSGEHASDLESYLHSRIWNDAGGFSFKPSDDSKVAASGHDADGNPIVGSPFDPLASRMLATTGSLPFHSGLFATAPAIANFFDGLGEPDIPDGTKLRELQRYFYGSRVIEGFTADGARISFGSNGLLSPGHPPYAPEGARPGRIYYQTGYTGCLLWIDTQTRTTVVLLTNASLTNAQDEATKLGQDIIQTLLLGMKR